MPAVISRRVRGDRPAPRLDAAVSLHEALENLDGQARLLRHPRRAQERLRGRHQEGLPQAGHEAPP
ncbi:MAG: hypothetical protein MZW92_69945 [Comamonadaceae bacterium]|nr:hypothetical protein [Comamonadaceae bacterium]